MEKDNAKLIDSYELSYCKQGLFKRLAKLDGVVYELKFKDPKGSIAIVYGVTYEELITNLKDYLKGLYD